MAVIVWAAGAEAGAMIGAIARARWASMRAVSRKNGSTARRGVKRRAAQS
jgi:hypothetical protein